MRIVLKELQQLKGTFSITELFIEQFVLIIHFFFPLMKGTWEFTQTFDNFTFWFENDFVFFDQRDFRSNRKNKFRLKKFNLFFRLKFNQPNPITICVVKFKTWPLKSGCQVWNSILKVYISYWLICFCVYLYSGKSEFLQMLTFKFSFNYF